MYQKGYAGLNGISFPKLDSKKPSVFLIIVESLNQSVIGKKTDDGNYITPFLSQLDQHSLSVEHFYGNSIQSARGLLSILFSLIPSTGEKVTQRYPNLHLKSLGKVMNDNGYKSIVFLAQPLNDFDNLLVFLNRNHFDVLSVKPFIQPEDAPFVWRRWGPEDRVFFKRFFDYYDQEGYQDQPIFVSLVTSASHFPFNSVPKSRRLLYSDPDSIHEEYANSVHLVDQGIKVFFDELRDRGILDDSIVLITSDHAMPMGEHGIYHQEAGYFDESFRIPFWIHWPKRLGNQKIEGPFSQMDIAPTILDLIDATVNSHHFMGKSIFSKDLHPVFLIQPYGKYLSVVQWPYKFIWSSRSGKISAYDLLKDPLETHDIWSDLSDEFIDSIMPAFHLIFRQQKLYELDEIYPRLDF